MRLIVGLGNPGPRHDQTRHNLGFQLLDRLVPPSEWNRWKDLGEFARGARGDTHFYLVRPLTYMNLSGRMVRDFAQFHRIGPEEALVCYDDFFLPLAALRIRRGGSAGGHNGMQSVIAEMGTEDIARIRLGIGPLPPGEDPARFVLGRLRADEKTALDRGLARACEAIEAILQDGIEAAMNRYNAPAVPDE
ncbi:MAG: aminoacyl-tRNA hydrolase [Elusimicrobia bacterium]|nr:aminoacyl-tRNA hydrolase [Elusimicrobiota bacterium]